MRILNTDSGLYFFFTRHHSTSHLPSYRSSYHNDIKFYAGLSNTFLFPVAYEKRTHLIDPVKANNRTT